MSLSTIFGLWVKSERDARSWTLDQVANSAGVSRASLWEIEHGRIKATLEHAEKIAGAFGYGLVEALTAATQEHQEPRAYEVAIQEALAMAERCATVLRRELTPGEKHE